MTATGTKDDLGRALVRSLRALRRVGDDRERRTQLYREIATASVDLREHFIVEETGEADWSGRSWAYREYIRDRYSEAGYQKDEARPVQTSVRYHVSARVRERLTPEQLEDLGLRADDMTKRMKDTRAVKSALLSTLDKAAAGDTPDVPRALAAAYLVLQKITPPQVGDLQGAARSQARAVLGRILRHAGELHAATEDAG